MRTQQTIAVAKDIVLFLGGLTGIAYQQITGNVHALLLLVFTAMVGIPGLVALWSLKDGATITVSRSSQSQESSQAPESRKSWRRLRDDSPDDY